MDERSLCEICKVHGLIIADVLRRMGAKGLRLDRIEFLVDEDGEEFLVCDRRGFHIVKEIRDDGGLKLHAVPGHFNGGHGFSWWVDDAKDAILYGSERNGRG